MKLLPEDKKPAVNGKNKEYFIKFKIWGETYEKQYIYKRCL